MKCAYFEKECIKGGAGIPCVNCMRDEIDHYKKKIDHYKKKAEGNTISITKDELITAQAEALKTLTVANPMILMLSDEMSVFAVLTVTSLFDKEKKS